MSILLSDLIRSTYWHFACVGRADGMSKCRVVKVGGQILEETSYDAFLHTEVLSYLDIKTAHFLTIFMTCTSQKLNKLYSIVALSFST